MSEPQRKSVEMSLWSRSKSARQRRAQQSKIIFSA